MPAPRTLTAVLLASLAVLAGCGRDDESDVRAALERYATAIEKRDYQTLCDDLLSEKLIEKLRNVNLPCEVALKRGLAEVDKPQITVRSVKIDGDTASAVARTDAANQEPSEDTIRLAREDGAWKIVALSSA